MLFLPLKMMACVQVLLISKTCIPEHKIGSKVTLMPKTDTVLRLT